MKLCFLTEMMLSLFLLCFCSIARILLVLVPSSPNAFQGLEIIDGIESGGATIEQLLEIEPDMVNAMKLYGDAQKKSEVPDKISIRLNKDAEAFSQGFFMEI